MSTSPGDPLTLFSVAPDSALSPYRQVHAAVVAAVADGRLQPGQKLPTVRALAAHLGVAVNTVAAGYRSLEQAGVIEGRGRAGTFVRLGENPVEVEARRIALDAARELIELGVGRERARDLLANAYDAANAV